jgi:putative ABC transport system substrate-binding protein
LAAIASLGAIPAGAQPAAKVRVGVLFGTSPAAEEAFLQQFRRGMKELGYVEGGNIEYLYRWAEGHFERIPALTNDLVSQGIKVILVGGVSVAQPVLEAQPTLPVVMAGGFDPVAAGLARSLARPGGNVTGVVNLSDELARKHLELIRTLLPRSRRIGVLCGRSAPHRLVVAQLQAEAKQRGFVIVPSTATGPENVAAAIARLGTSRIDAAILVASPIFTTSRPTLLEFAGKLNVPIVYPDSPWIPLGGLMSYGPDREVIFHRAAHFVDKILKGANPGELPIEQPTKFEMVINKKTAKALGLNIPPELLLLADRVIE